MAHHINLPLTQALLVLLLGLLPQEGMAADCSYCQESPANGSLWLENAPGSVKATPDATRPSLDKVNTHENVTWRKDGLGNIKGSDGSIYRPNALGQFDRNGKTSLPPHLQTR